jgi:hypothetical protein
MIPINSAQAPIVTGTIETAFGECAHPSASEKTNQFGGKSIERGVTEVRDQIFLNFPQVRSRA